MHVDTDIFCAPPSLHFLVVLLTRLTGSAGVVLPDKAGRQLNIGGWSLESTFGLRFYTPDGSPGTSSKNDWEENYRKVSLQAGACGVPVTSHVLTSTCRQVVRAPRWSYLSHCAGMTSISGIRGRW